MYLRLVVTLTAFSVFSGLAVAQSRRASAMRGGNSDRGKCTIEVVVDGAAEVEIRGDTANLRNLSGQPPQWRRFECTGPLPPNPIEFRFAGVDGRGRQELIRDPRNGGVAVVRIEDPDNGAEGYTFDLTWINGGAPGRVAPMPPPVQEAPRDPRYDRDRDPRYDRDRDPRDRDEFHREREEWFRGDNWRAHFFDRIRDDLEHVQAVTWPGTADQYRLVRTKQELNELQGKLSAGRYDERQLDDVIAAMQRVVRDNRLLRQDRELLMDDLNRLRDFRERHDSYGARGPRY